MNDLLAEDDAVDFNYDDQDDTADDQSNQIQLSSNGKPILVNGSSTADQIFNRSPPSRVKNGPSGLNRGQNRGLPSDIRTFSSRPNLPSDIRTVPDTTNRLPSQIKTVPKPISLPSRIRTVPGGNSLPSQKASTRAISAPSKARTVYPDSVKAELSSNQYDNQQVSAWETNHISDFGQMVNDFGQALLPNLIVGGGQSNGLGLQWKNKYAIDEANKLVELINGSPLKLDPTPDGMIKWRWGKYEEIIIRDCTSYTDFHLLPYPHFDILTLAMLMPLKARVAHKVNKCCHGVHYDDGEQRIWIKAPNWKAAIVMGAVVKALNDEVITHHAAMRLFDVLSDLIDSDSKLLDLIGQYLTK
jgi:hypothetical protein